MIAFAKTQNSNFDPEIAKAFIKVGNKYGVRGDIAFCQSIIETGWFKYTGGTAVTPNQHNYCGLGVTSKGMKGNSFATVELGVTAQIQHLFAYGSKNALPTGETLIDPRFKYVTRGIAPNWEDLSMKWAMNANYGKDILNIYTKLIATKVPTKPETPKPVEPAKPTTKPTEKKDVLFTNSTIDNKKIPSVVIDGKGYIAVSNVADLLNLKALYDTVNQEIIFTKK